MTNTFRIHNENGGRIANVNGEYLFVEIGGLKVQLKSEFEGVVIDVFSPGDKESEHEAVASTYAFYPVKADES